MNAPSDIADRIVEQAKDMAEGDKGAAITVDTPLTEVFDSFAIFEFLLQLEDSFGVEIDTETIPDDTPMSARTFAGIVAAKLA